MFPLLDALKTLAKQGEKSIKHSPVGKMSVPPYIWVSLGVSILFSSVVGFGAGIAAPFFLNKIPVEKLPDFMRSVVEENTSPRIGDIEQLTPTKEITKEKTIVEKEYIPQTSQEDRVVNIVKDVSPSVVSIVISKDVPVLEQSFTNPFEDFKQFFGDDFFGPFQQQFQVPQYRQKGTEKREVGGGTGFIIASDGLIVTNKHVVQDAQAEYTVLTNKGEKYPAQVLARDPFKDLAVIKVNALNLPAAKLGNSDALQPGQSVVAIGNALGEFQNTVSVGVVSGLNRNLAADGEVIEGVIQTDTAINRGNSGGPLLSLRGEVIGINTAMVIGAQNIGFAIPINEAKKMITDVETTGKISYPFLGIRYVVITPELKEQQKLSVDYGAWVIRGEKREDVAVIPGSSADKAGIVENDIILEVDGTKITKDVSLSKIVQGHKVGDTVIMKVLRKGAEISVSALLQATE